MVYYVKAHYNLLIFALEEYYRYFASFHIYFANFQQDGKIKNCPCVYVSLEIEMQYNPIIWQKIYF